MADDPVQEARLKRLSKYTVEQLRRHWLELCGDGAVMPNGKKSLVAALVILELRAGTVGGRGHG